MKVFVATPDIFRGQELAMAAVANKWVLVSIDNRDMRGASFAKLEKGANRGASPNINVT